MGDLDRYFYAREKAASAYQQYNYAAAHLDNCRIMERLAEIRSQHEPLASLIDKPMGERERLYAVAHYVAVGRFPEIAPRDSGKE